ncbi:glycosyltransferase family 61 protein [Rhodocytophaga rosea]|uniref:Glycosyltransferase family 61 protein n=1 Tax=Rhodocytophaga rosea TaxID=2704465 RepID=A0A6C0GED3_9BACT|nr:glycosyltransferase family 61 protein [Rhodocytophaga rosea]QHT66133.1 glycosyltransferase family 61 protein [Rhodocytophaga rosea]
MNTKIYLKKIYKKIFDVSTKIIPYQTYYRPNGFYWSVNDENSLLASEEATYTEAFPRSTPDIEFNDPYYKLCTTGLEPELVASIPAAFIVKIPQGRLQQNMLGVDISVISKNNKLIGEISYQYVRSNVAAPIYEHDILRQKLFLTPKRYKGTVFSMLSGDVASSNIFHWLYDALPRLYILKESGLLNTVDWFLMPVLKHKYHKESLRILGIDLNKIIECSEYIHLQADTLLITSPVRHKGITPNWVCKAHHKYFVTDLATQEADYPPLVYIRRGDSSIRQITNEGQLMAMLEKKGFKSYLLSQLPFAEQVKLFSNAKVIVAAHGAGLANLAFCKEGTALIELFAPGYIKPTYQVISKKSGIDYTYMICKAASDNTPASMVEAMNQNMVVDVEEVSKQLFAVMQRVGKLTSLAIPHP